MAAETTTDAGDQWESLLGQALTGELMALPPVGLEGVLASLAEQGWALARIADHVAVTAAADQPWPHPDPLAAGRFGAARWHAAVAELTRRLGLDVSYRPPSRRTQLDADERRLLLDVPPHHGS